MCVGMAGSIAKSHVGVVRRRAPAYAGWQMTRNANSNANARGSETHVQKLFQAAKGMLNWGSQLRKNVRPARTVVSEPLALMLPKPSGRAYFSSSMK